MTEESSNNMYPLISKYLAAEASPLEKASVEAWILSSEKNKREFEQLQKLWEHSSFSGQEEKIIVDVDMAWKKLQDRIQLEEVPVHSLTKEKSQPDLYFYISRSAAIILLTFAVYLLYQLIDNTPKEIKLIATESLLMDTLPDKSKIALNRNSQITFPEKFEGEQRRLHLSGEAFFDVQSNPQKAFVVKVDGAEISVLGTSFLVQAYDSLTYIKVVVREGRVKVTSSKDSIVLTAGQSILLDKRSEVLGEIKDYDTNELFWLSGKLVFKNQKLQEVFQALEKHFDIQIRLENDKILDCRLTATFENENIEDIFEIISASFNLSIENRNNIYLVDGEGCV